MTPGDELHQVLEAAATEHGVPGAAAAVVIGDDTWVATHGVGNVEHPRPVRSTSLFQVGSVSKTFTAAAAMLLVEEGRLALGDPVGRHLPDLATATGLDLDAITVEIALSHQAGFDGDHLFTARGQRLEDLAGARQLFPPGAGFSYNNAGFSLVGAVIEAVSGQELEAFLRDRIFDPLGMATATFRADEAITHDVTAPHWVHGDEAFVLRRAGWQPGWELSAVDRAAGGLIASIDEMVRWCRFQGTGTADDGTVVMSPASLARLHTPVVGADALDDIALDWFVREIGGVTTIGHGGTTVGYVTDLLVVPEKEVAFVGLTNAVNGGSVNQAVRRWALERFAGIVERDPRPDPAPTVDLGPLLGRFEHAFAVLTVTAGAAPGTVVVTPSRRSVDGWQPPVGPPVTFGWFAPDHLVSLDAPGPVAIVRFGPAADGRSPWLLWSSRRAPRVD